MPAAHSASRETQNCQPVLETWWTACLFSVARHMKFVPDKVSKSPLHVIAWIEDAFALKI
jgi:hypothetical protein